jgi:hypothetical protein
MKNVLCSIISLACIASASLAQDTIKCATDDMVQRQYFANAGPSFLAGSRFYRLEQGPIIDQNIMTAVVYVDFKNGRILRNGRYEQPTTTQDILSMSLNDRDAVGSLGWNGSYPNQTYKPLKYTYYHYYREMFATGNEWIDDGSSHPHPDYGYFASMGKPEKMGFVTPIGSVLQYYTQVANNNARITPTLTRFNTPWPFDNGIVNNLLPGTHNLDWIMLDRDKDDYNTMPQLSMCTTLRDDVLGTLRDLYQRQVIEFDVDLFFSWHGRLIIIYAGGPLIGGHWGMALPVEPGDPDQIIITQEKNFHNTFETSSLSGNSVVCHE